MNTYSSTFQHIYFALTSCLFGHTNSNVFSGFITARSPQSHRGGSSSRLTVAKCFSLAVIGGGLGGGRTHRSKCSRWCRPLHQSSKRRYLGSNLSAPSIHWKKKHLSWAYTTKFQQNISNLVIQMKKKYTKTITYIKTTARVQATSRCVRMSWLKHVGRTTTVTVRDREVGREGASLLDSSGYNSLGWPCFRHNCSRNMSSIYIVNIILTK